MDRAQPGARGSTNRNIEFGETTGQYTDGWIVPADGPTLSARRYTSLDEMAFNEFDAAYTIDSLIVTIDPREAFVDGWLARDVATDIELDGDTAGRTVVIGGTQTQFTTISSTTFATRQTKQSSRSRAISTRFIRLLRPGRSRLTLTASSPQPISGASVLRLILHWVRRRLSNTRIGNKLPNSGTATVTKSRSLFFPGRGSKSIDGEATTLWTSLPRPAWTSNSWMATTPSKSLRTRLTSRIPTRQSRHMRTQVARIRYSCCGVRTIPAVQSETGTGSAALGCILDTGWSKWV